MGEKSERFSYVPRAPFELFQLKMPPRNAPTAGVNQDPIALLSAKFASLNKTLTTDVNLIVGLGSNTDDRARRDQLYADWGREGGRQRDLAEIKAFADFVQSLTDRCK